MLRAPTVFIIGAGASVDFGLPVGTGLANDIVHRLGFYFGGGQLTQGDPYIAQALQSRYASDFSRYFLAARNIAAGLPSFKSIDDYLFTHSADEAAMVVGKMAILTSIAYFESKSTLAGFWHPDQEAQQASLASLRKSWVHTLIQTLVTGVRREDRLELFRDISIVTFNYDRCLETALYHGIQAPLQIDGNEAARVLDGLKIYRPYGGLGPLLETGPEAVPYGPNAGIAVKFGNRIRVYTESYEERSDMIEMRETLSAAGQLVFMGFGFHRQNMELLDIGSHKDRVGRMVLATAFRESLTARAVFETRIRETLSSLEKPTIPLSTEDCASFLQEHAITLST